MTSRIFAASLIACALGVAACSSWGSCGNPGGSATSGGASSGGGPSGTTPRTPIPDPFVGSWSSGNVSVTTFFNPSTGSFASPSGPGVSFDFTSEGAYRKAVLLRSSQYQCEMTFYAYIEGTVAVNGATFALYPTTGKDKSEDTCVEANNYEKVDPLTQETSQVEHGVDEYGAETLWVSAPGGTPSAFHRLDSQGSRPSGVSRGPSGKGGGHTSLDGVAVRASPSTVFL
jgi:hypothetical protein